MNITALRTAFKGDKLEPVNVSLRDITASLLNEFVEDYSDWYERRGIHIPDSYNGDATAYTEDLHKMKRAFRLLAEELEGEGELWDAKHAWEAYGEKDVMKIEELEAEIREGMLLFGKNLYYMTDTKKGTAPGR